MANNIRKGRREFLDCSMRTAMAAGIGAALLPSFGSYTRAAEVADGQISKPGMAKPVTSEALFRMGVIGPAELSLMSSELAMKKCQQTNAHEFAGFEHTEAIAVTTVLKELATPVPAPDEMATKLMADLNGADGKNFDKLYIKAQLANHEFLRDHAEDYLKHSDPKTNDPAEQQTQHLAQLALAVFKEHVAICQRISAELGGQ